MKKLIYLLVGLLLIACSEDTAKETDNCFGDQVIYLAENGITIKACDQANVGDTGVIEGITYTVVDEAILRELVANEADVTQVVTSKVTDMSYLFYNSETFNQDISSWDVSKVTNMEIMFDNTGDRKSVV